MIPDADILTRLHEILKNSDLDTATAGTVRKQLENDFGADLSDRKAFIRTQIDIYLETLRNNHQDSPNEEQNDDGGDEEDDVEETDTKRSGKKGEKEVKKRGGGGGFTKLCSLSPKLQNLVGEPQLARTQVVKKMWAYIREKNLQDPKDKRVIKCDEPLRDLFRVNSINMFQMNKALSKHIWPLTPEAENETLKVKAEDSDGSMSEGDDPGVKEEEKEEEEEGEGEGEEEEEAGKDCSDRSKKKGKSPKPDKNVKKRGGGGFSKVCSLSPELQVVTGAPELARTEVVKRIWAYIREKNLQDPKNKKSILCDESMRAVFQVDSIDMFQMNKALSAHIWPLNKEDGPDKSLEEDRNCKREREEDLDEPKQKEKQQKNGGSSLQAK
ncbi:SWIB complex BAF60b domain-containing protein [Euphorbia peplus]|nr:SWIB complex BAF60b domain-containing protein [Euphorbia peplus]